MPPETVPTVVDLSSFRPIDASVLKIRQPGTATPTGWEVTFAGPSHPKTVAWSNDSARETLHRQAQIEAQQLNGRKIKPEEREVSDVRRENVRWVVSRILGWTPVRLGPDGTVLEFSEKAATDLLVDPAFGWVYAQMIEFLNDERSFTKASATA